MSSPTRYLHYRYGAGVSFKRFDILFYLLCYKFRGAVGVSEDEGFAECGEKVRGKDEGVRGLEGMKWVTLHFSFAWQTTRIHSGPPSFLLNLVDHFAWYSTVFFPSSAKLRWSLLSCDRSFSVSEMNFSP